MPFGMPSFNNLLGNTTSGGKKNPNAKGVGTNSENIDSSSPENHPSLGDNFKYEPNSPKRTKQDNFNFDATVAGDDLEVDSTAPISIRNNQSVTLNRAESPRMNLRSVSGRSSSSPSLQYGQEEIIDQQQHIWTISNWASFYQSGSPMLSPSDLEEDSVNDGKLYGPEFESGGAVWRLLVFPRGNEKHDFIAAYLKFCGFADEKDSRYSICVDFKISILTPQPIQITDTDNNFDSKGIYEVSNQAYYRFNEDNNDWGFSCFVRVVDAEQLIDLNDCLTFNTTITILSDPIGKRWNEQFPWNSRKETGYVGIRNQGATCYMNSMLQSLYFTNILRKAIYQIPTQKDKPGESLLLALQTFFYQLQANDSYADTTELIKIFGWGFGESLEHHDVQEFFKVLQDAIERKLKNFKIENPFDEIFSGKVRYIVKCINIEYMS